MAANCDSEGIGGELKTSAMFGCVEFAPAHVGWDHHRLHCREVSPEGQVTYVADDTAHAEGRF